MRRVDLEVLVQQQVERVRAGRPVEDDRIELKRQWPEPNKCARQLAGAANALRGEALVYVIGCDERTGEITALDGTDPESWYRQVAKRFDSEPPRLLAHVNVGVGDDPADTVVALHFETDVFPYVMGVEGKSDRREVPVRVASATASANRQQLLAILAPALSTPDCQLVGADATVATQGYDEYTLGETRHFPERTEVRVSVRLGLLVAYTRPTPISFLSQSASMTVSFADTDISIRARPAITVRGTKRGEVNPDSQIAAVGGLGVVRGPGILNFRMSSGDTHPTASAEHAEMLARVGAMGNSPELHVALHLPFIGASSPVRLNTVLPAQPNDEDAELAPPLPFKRTWATAGGFPVGP